MISLPCLKPSSDFPLHLEEKLTSLSWLTRPCNLVPASFCDLTSCHMLSMTIPSPMSSLLLCHLRFSAPSKRYECIAPTSMPLRLTYSLVSLNVDSLQNSLSTCLFSSLVPVILSLCKQYISFIACTTICNYSFAWFLIYFVSSPGL